jgi:hypothetical protein
LGGNDKPRGENHSRPVGSYVTHRTKRRFDLPQVSEFDVRQTASSVLWQLAMFSSKEIWAWRSNQGDTIGSQSLPHH